MRTGERYRRDMYCNLDNHWIEHAPKVESGYREYRHKRCTTESSRRIQIQTMDVLVR